MLDITSRSIVLTVEEGRYDQRELSFSAYWVGLVDWV